MFGWHCLWHAQWNCEACSEVYLIEHAAPTGLAPETPPKANKKGSKEGEAKTGATTTKKRQPQIDELLHKTRHGAVAKSSKAAKKNGITAGEILQPTVSYNANQNPRMLSQYLS